MWTVARAELKELMKLTKEVATYDATLAAKPDLKPSQEAMDRLTAMQDRRLALMDKYELTDGWQSR